MAIQNNIQLSLFDVVGSANPAPANAAPKAPTPPPQSPTPIKVPTPPAIAIINKETPTNIDPQNTIQAANLVASKAINFVMPSGVNNHIINVGNKPLPQANHIPAFTTAQLNTAAANNIVPQKPIIKIIENNVPTPTETPIIILTAPADNIAKAKTVNAKILQNRGRKSQANMAAEANFVNLPPDAELYSKQYYSIGQVAAMFNANVSKIRFWEEQLSALLKVRKNRKGDRFFTPQNIKTLHNIYMLTSKQGLTMSGAAQFLQANKTTLPQKNNLLQDLTALKTFLLSLEAGLLDA